MSRSGQAWANVFPLLLGAASMVNLRDRHPAISFETRFSAKNPRSCWQICVDCAAARISPLVQTDFLLTSLQRNHCARIQASEHYHMCALGHFRVQLPSTRILVFHCKASPIPVGSTVRCFQAKNYAQLHLLDLKTCV